MSNNKRQRGGWGWCVICQFLAVPRMKTISWTAITHHFLIPSIPCSQSLQFKSNIATRHRARPLAKPRAEVAPIAGNSRPAGLCCP
jgi:hypothetical protein